MRIDSIPYYENSAILFRQLIAQPWAVFLDSGRPYLSQGRYDILTSNPYITLTTWKNITVIQTKNRIHYSKFDPFLLLKQALRTPVPQHSVHFPFTGGAIGYFSYDLARHLERLPNLARDQEQLPDMAVGLFDWIVIVDHIKKESWLIGQGNDPDTFKYWEQLKRLLSTQKAKKYQSFKVLSNVQSNMTKNDYEKAFKKIKSYIHNGDCYQVNLAQRFAAHAWGNPWQLYQKLRTMNPAPFSSYLHNPYVTVLSSSPERFLLVKNGYVETKPIKGTRPRSENPVKDQVLLSDLIHSEKDQAENLMIVDLLRNDLGKTCQYGSIQVPKLFEPESFATVHHLVSTITGQLTPGKHALDLLRDCFPGGSITGAPKVRAMEIIEELEPNRRGVYCGAIGYIGYNGNMDTNIAIRTMIYNNNEIRYWAGGGLVEDSQLESEYEEIQTKAAVFFDLMTQCQKYL